MTARRQKGEGSVFKRADGRWVAMLDLGRQHGLKRRRKAIYGRTQAEVIKKLNAAKRELDRHGDVPSQVPTVADWLHVWLDEIAPDRVRPTTLPSYRSKIERYIIPAIGRHRLDRLAPEHIRAMYRAMRQRGLAEATVRQTHAILSRALTVAVMEGKANRNAAQLVDPPGTQTADPKALTPDEIARVLAAMVGDRLESRWLAALTLGLRQGEALGLGWDQVDLADGTLTVTRALARIKGEGLVMVPPKSKKSVRTVPLPNVLHASLLHRREAYEAERERAGYVDLGLVWARRNGRPVEPTADWQAWADLLERAGVDHRRLHDARHAAATTLASLGVPVDVRMAILGHSQISMAMHYTHLDLTPMREAMALVDRAHRAIEP